MLKNILYAILLGVGMAACLADHDNTGQADSTANTTAGEAMSETVEPNTEATDPANLVLAKGQAGWVRIGMPIEEMRDQVPAGWQVRDTTLQLEGQQSTAYVLSNPESPHGMLVEQLCESNCQVWRISIRDTSYRTAQGIGVGAKYGEVAQLHPIDYASLGEAGFVAVSERSGMSFVLDSSQLDQHSLHKLKPDQIPANTLVRSILIY